MNGGTNGSPNGSTPPPHTTLPAEAYAAALASLPGVGPGRLAGLLTSWSPAHAWARVRDAQVAGQPWLPRGAGERDALVTAWSRAARTADVAAVWRRYAAAGVSVHLLGTPGYPPLLAADHAAPAVLFSVGRVEALGGRRVAVVGTRRCTRYGRDVAYELGRELSGQGVTVVSGLALGVDGAAHTGALDAGGAPPVAVVGSGLDVVYPRRHRALWQQLEKAGLILSEAPLGARPESWRFPVRNRIIAALSEVVVVVESHASGGSRHTVEAAATRGRPVMAVPGSVRSSASAYPNALLADGCHPVRDALDVMVALDLSPGSRTRAPDRRPPPDPVAAAVLDAMGWEPANFEEVVLRSGRPPSEASVALAKLERDGWISGRGGWWERVA